MARHCPECGFVVTEGANYCQRCGAYVGTREETRDDATTATYMVDENTGELKPVDVGDVAASTGALVIRSGGGRVGQSFPLEGERLTIGRSPDAEIFLDDVTVSRDHAVLVRRSGEWFLDDSGSLNGTYVNRRRIESFQTRRGLRRELIRRGFTDIEFFVDRPKRRGFLRTLRRVRRLMASARLRRAFGQLMEWQHFLITARKPLGR